jgi:hypothetical protein
MENWIALDFVSGMPSSGSPVWRNTRAVPGWLKRAAGITAVNCVLLTKVVPNLVVLSFTVHIPMLPL